MPTIVKTLVDIGPLIVFYVTESYSDIFVATGFLMVACLIAFAVSWKMTKKLALLPLLTLAFALVFGGFTLLFEDDTFIKVEVTLTNGLLGIFLLGGMYFEKSLLKILFDSFADMTEEGWNKITWRMGWFFVAIAILNEFVWRTFSTDIWVDFRVFGILGLTFAFLAIQAPTAMRHMVDESSVKDD
ncbi:MAG: inner membrane-spanning protein YciB [Rhizobiaceae bacterium]